jgi:hypothetical protein
LKPFLFTGDASDAVARVYASSPRAGLPPDARLGGQLVGPHCRYSQTLPARISFADRGPGETLLAEAVVPDPCFWTPELPFTYIAELRLEHGGSAPSGRGQGESAVNSTRQVFGIRRLGTHQRSIYLDAKRFVIRGFCRPAIDDDALGEARKLSAALLTVDVSEALCREATEAGILLVVDLTQKNQPIDALTRLARWPAVALIVLDADPPQSGELRAAARNTLFAQRIVNDEPVRLAPWAKCILWQIDSQHLPQRPPDSDLPLIVYRPRDSDATIKEARAACDQLQADLAPLGDFAGYFT